MTVSSSESAFTTTRECRSVQRVPKAFTNVYASSLSPSGRGDLDKFAAVYRQLATRLPPDLPVISDALLAAAASRLTA